MPKPAVRERCVVVARHRVRARAGKALALVTASVLAAQSAAAGGPRVASINLCTDQLVLSLADDEQIVTVSWLSADPEESMLAHRAARFPLNYGSAEELLRYAPDVVVGGSLTGAYTRGLLTRLGYTVVEIAPAQTIDDIAHNLAVVADAIGQSGRGRRLITTMRARERSFRQTRPETHVATVVVRPGGFTVGDHSLAQQLITLAGLDNVAVEEGLDRWGSLSIETLVRSAPQLLIFTAYRAGQPSLANTVFEHPALVRMAARTATAIVPGAQWGCGLPQSLDSVATMRRAAAALTRERKR